MYGAAVSWAAPVRPGANRAAGCVVSVLLTLAIVLGAVALLLYFLISDVAANIAQLANNINIIFLVQGWLKDRTAWPPAAGGYC